MSLPSFPAKFLTFIVISHLNSPVYANDAAAATPFPCANCNVCQSACRPPTYEPTPLLPLPPPPIAEPEPLPVPNAPANCPPAVVQCCPYMPLPPPSPFGSRNGDNIYKPLYNKSSSSLFLTGGLVYVLATMFCLAGIL